jgi:hypothetical protein
LTGARAAGILATRDGTEERSVVKIGIGVPTTIEGLKQVERLREVV